MIVRTLEEANGTDRDVDTPQWRSRRLLLADDKMGFSMHDTLIRAGSEIPMCYLNHLEAVYCVAGEGEVHVDGEEHPRPIKDGTLYALDQHDKHVLRATSDMRMICVFNPALTGREVHGADGAYPPAEAMSSS